MGDPVDEFALTRITVRNGKVAVKSRRINARLVVGYNLAR